jgi:hypothetical protein
MGMSKGMATAGKGLDDDRPPTRAVKGLLATKLLGPTLRASVDAARTAAIATYLNILFDVVNIKYYEHQVASGYRRKKKKETTCSIGTSVITTENEGDEWTKK